MRESIRTRYHLLVAAVLVTAASRPASAEEAWSERGNLEAAEGNLSLCQKWDPAQGLQFRFETQDKARGLRVNLLPGKVDLVPLGDRAIPDTVAACAALSPAALPTNVIASAAVVVKVRDGQWSIYVQNRPIAAFPPPFQPPATLATPTSQLPPPDTAKVRYQRVGDIAFNADFLDREGNTNQLADWEILAGDWKLHTALEDVLARQKLASGSRVPLPDRSPNFYSLEGAGTNAIITHGYAFQDCYDVEAATQVSRAEAGIAFYVQSTQQFHAFTVQLDEAGQQADLRLWRHGRPGTAGRTPLAAARIAMTPGQWLKLKVRTSHDRAICSVDGTTVMDVPVELPVGGAFGLIVNGDGHARFDDVKARSNNDLYPRTRQDIRRYLVAQSGSLLPERPAPGQPPAADNTCALEAAPKHEPQWVIIGSTRDAGHVIQADFAGVTEGETVGLITAYTGSDAPALRFTYQPGSTNERFRLERAAGTNTALLEEFNLPAAPANAKDRPAVQLLSDATNPGELRLYRNGELVLIHPTTNDLHGASGPYVGPDSGVRITQLAYRFTRDELHHSQYEKNPLFSTDPFMLHWSSPEGQWITMKDKTTWHKSDFFGRFLLRMPYVAGSVIHVGVGEGQTNGQARLVIGKSELALFVNDRRVAAAPTNSLVADKKGTHWYTLHHEDHWLWVTSGNALLLKHALPAGLAGTRIRVEGFAEKDFKQAYVERYDVKDFLFTESPHAWTVNGGKWQVVNRFQCDPRWSHMDGESGEGLAALWGKYDIEGDFCIEFYAGIRHGTEWYKRCGDLNLTVMNDRTSPSRGYTITCTGWDPDHSQRLTKLYRNGVVVAESDKYLAPRHREGNLRHGYVPLLPPGHTRDVHGAWYYMKLRRIGHKLEYYFDNELVFTYDDAQPLNPGSFGIWTFLNSMVVARVKVAAERIWPRPVAFETLPVPRPAPKQPPPQTSPFRLAEDGRPFELSTPDNWRIEDPVGHARMSWGATSDREDTLMVETALGAGPMFARCTLPPVPYDTLAGWRFFVKRTPHAQFNLHYSIGRFEDGAKTPPRHYFHRLSGTEFDKGDYTLTGRTDVPGTPITNADWSVTGPWTPVNVWLPPQLAAESDAGKRMVRLDGFGNLQPSFVIQGLTGNAPGEAYAVRGLTEIRYTRPRLAAVTNMPPPQAFSLLDRASGQRLCNHPTLASLQQWLNGHGATGLVQTVLLAEWKSSVARKELSWINLPPSPSISCRWNGERGDAVDLVLNADYPDRRFAAGHVSVAGENVDTLAAGFTTRTARIPRTEAGALTNGLPVAFEAAGHTNVFMLKSDASRPKTAPVLVKLEGPAAFFENFEQGRLGPPLDTEGVHARIEQADPVQGLYLEVYNPGTESRLKHQFTTNLQLSTSPVLQFRYRAEIMAQVTLSLGYYAFANLGEAYVRAVAVRYGEPLKRDNQWHTWTGMVSDAVKGNGLNRYWFTAQRIAMGSLSTIDQTGLYSTLGIDDIVAGPAVARAEQLQFTPHYLDWDGTPTVFVTTRAGAAAFAELPPEQTAALVWNQAPNGKPVTPDITKLPDGLGHLLIKARGANGVESAVTDIPFLIDRTSDTTAYAFTTTTDLQLNGTLLDVTVDTKGGAPIDLRPITLSWGGKTVQPLAFGSSFIHTPTQDKLSLNWPFLLQEQICAMTNGQTGTLVVSGIKDGAGNPTPNVEAPITLDYASDKTAPTMLETEHPSNVVWCAEWEERSYKRRGRAGARRFAVTAEHEVKLVMAAGQEPFFAHRTLGEASDVLQDFAKPFWDLRRFPQLAFEVRRPDMKAEDKTQISLLIETTADKKLAVRLTPETDDKESVGLPAPIQWQTNRWHTVNVNLLELCQQPKPLPETEPLLVKRLTFRVRKARAKVQLQLRNVFAFSPWGKEDSVKLQAYDASGVREVIWAYAKGEALPTDEKAWQRWDGLTFTPALLTPPKPEDRWVVIRARDRAGNVSVPTRIPIVQ